MASTTSVHNLSGVLASMSQSIDEFRSESDEIEQRFFELVAGIAAQASPASDGESGTTTSEIEMLAVERLDGLDRSIAEQREELSGKQDQLANDVGQLRELVDRQVQLFTTLISSTAKLKQTAPRKGKRKNSSEDEVLNDVFAQFEELRAASAKVSEAAKT